MTDFTSETPYRPRTKMSGDDARRLIADQLTKHEAGISSALSQYDASRAVRTWHMTIRAVEEFINLPLFGIEDTATEQWLLDIPLDGRLISNPVGVFSSVRNALAGHLDAAVIERYLVTLMQTAAAMNALRLMGLRVSNVGEAVAYYQSRRRHMVSLLYTMPRVCKGLQKLDLLDSLNILLPIIEHSCITITGLHHQLALLEILPDFHLDVDAVGALASHGYDTLDTAFLEPERASIMAMVDFRRDQFVLPEMESTSSRKIFSAAELRNNMKVLGSTYDAYGLNDAEFCTLTGLVDRLSREARDDYFIHVPKQRFTMLLADQSAFDPVDLERMLVNRPGDYATNTNAYEPFIDLGQLVVSNVNLLSRYLYAFKNVHLGSRRRFQIHAGFIFEEMVKRDLEEMGFELTAIKRINRKEFDVVATYQNAIYNFQCKNNWVDLSKVESDRKLFVRYNRALTTYYSRALEKERQREHLLKAALGIQTVHHYVISRFPVIGAAAHVINYNNIHSLKRER